jgi:hypothetical protein
MKFIRKRGIKKIKISHNKKLFWIIIGLIILLILVFVIKYKKNNEFVGIVEGDLCAADSDCVQACGCHPGSCVLKLERPQCPRDICTQVCSGPLDCGAGSCGCVNHKCAVVPNE